MKPEPMVEVQYNPAYPPLTARLVESSRPHLYLLLEDPLPAGVDVVVRLRFPGEAHFIEVGGRILWSDQHTMCVEVEPGAPGSIVERERPGREASVMTGFWGEGTRETGRGVMARQERLDRRRYPRIIVGARTKGWVDAIVRASILNLSAGGALIEVAEIARPGTISDLAVTLARRDMRLRCHVVYSRVNRRELQPDGEQALIYQTGLEFLGRSNEAPVGDQRSHPVDYRRDAKGLQEPSRQALKKKLGQVSRNQLENMQTHERLVGQGLVYLPSSAEAVTMEDGEVVRLPLSRRVDSRRESRIAVEVPVGCRHLEATDSGPSEPLVGEIIDVSQGGAQLWLPRRVPLFGRLEVFMRIEGLNFQGQAEVVGAEVHPKDGRYRHGLRWLGLNAQAKAALSQVIPQLI